MAKVILILFISAGFGLILALSPHVAAILLFIMLVGYMVFS